MCGERQAETKQPLAPNRAGFFRGDASNNTLMPIQIAYKRCRSPRREAAVESRQSSTETRIRLVPFRQGYVCFDNTSRSAVAADCLFINRCQTWAVAG